MPMILRYRIAGRCGAMVAGMTRFTASAGCALIAEGIETANELTALRRLKVQYGQGFYLARPAEA